MQWIFLRHLRTPFLHHNRRTRDEWKFQKKYNVHAFDVVEKTGIRDGCTDAVEASNEQQLRAFHIKDARKEIT